MVPLATCGGAHRAYGQKGGPWTGTDPFGANRRGARPRRRRGMLGGFREGMLGRFPEGMVGGFREGMALPGDQIQRVHSCGGRRQLGKGVVQMAGLLGRRRQPESRDGSDLGRESLLHASS
jgi:hypothetical protein